MIKQIKATYHNGQIIPDDPVDWPEGQELIIQTRPTTGEFGLTEEEQSNDPEAIEKWIQWYDSLEPLIMTPEEEAEWKKTREAQKEFEKSKFFERTDKLEKIWE
jgi:hypothetical protein